MERKNALTVRMRCVLVSGIGTIAFNFRPSMLLQKHTLAIMWAPLERTLRVYHQARTVTTIAQRSCYAAISRSPTFYRWHGWAALCTVSCALVLDATHLKHLPEAVALHVREL